MGNFALCVTYFPAVVVIWNKMGWEEGLKKADTSKDSDQNLAKESPAETEIEKLRMKP